MGTPMCFAAALLMSDHTHAYIGVYTMTTVLRQASDTTVNVLTAVATVANSATKLVNGASIGADKLDLYMRSSLFYQQKTDAADRSDFMAEIVDDKAMAAAERQAIILNKLGKPVDMIQLFTENHARLSAVVLPE